MARDPIKKEQNSYGPQGLPPPRQPATTSGFVRVGNSLILFVVDASLLRVESIPSQRPFLNEFLGFSAFFVSISNTENRKDLP